MTFNTLIQTAPFSITSRLDFLSTLVERKDYHPEANTLVHIQMVTDCLVATGDINLILTGVLHDICKGDDGILDLTGGQDGFPTSPGHGPAAAKLIQSDLDIQKWIIALGGDIQRICDLCDNHMRIKQFDHMPAVKQQRFRDLDCFDDLLVFTAGDKMVDDDMQPMTLDQKIAAVLKAKSK